MQACTALVALVESGGRLPTDLLENALEAVARGLAAARQQLEAAASQLAAARRGGWACALLAAADACMHSEAWHAAWHADADGGAQAYKRTVELARDMLRQDLLPLLADASAQQDAATGFCLAPQYRALLTMGALLGAGPGWGGRPTEVAAGMTSWQPALVTPFYRSCHMPLVCRAHGSRHCGHARPTAPPPGPAQLLGAQRAVERWAPWGVCACGLYSRRAHNDWCHLMQPASPLPAGIQKLWTCVPTEVRADMERQGGCWPSVGPGLLWRVLAAMWWCGLPSYLSVPATW